MAGVQVFRTSGTKRNGISIVQLLECTIEIENRSWTDPTPNPAATSESYEQGSRRRSESLDHPALEANAPHLWYFTRERA